ncbi:MAG TPA: alpha-ketoglutarate-dependent dioxygenase AlkB [Acidimicrobiales bacterium]|jgi:alkylated DNA repair dioxygenase AlkB
MARAAGGDQPDLFEVAGEPVRLDLPDADVVWFPGFFPPAEADRLLAALLATTPWQQEVIRVYGRPRPVPRLTSWHGDPGRRYAYSGIEMDPVPWTPALLEVKERIEAVAGERFNSVLANWYRDGQDSVSWHSDDEPELGPEPTIGSVSFGDTRRFQLRHKRVDAEHAMDLTHGGFLLMRGPTQRCWRHQVPKTSRPVGQRVNLTFRVILDRRG